MKDLKIVPYTTNDNEQALALEKQCIQGKSMALSFQRPSFHARSEVYENYKIYCAKINNKLVGTCAGAEKIVTLHGKQIRSVYFYDLRIHPDHRHQGIAKLLNNAVVDSFGSNVDCYYSFIAGQNKRAVDIACKGFGAQVVIPFTYMIFPVYKKLPIESRYEISDAFEIHKNHLHQKEKLDFISEFDKNNLTEYVTSFRNKGSGASIWTNENLLCERVERLPLYLQIYRMLSNAIRPIINLPVIPKKHESLKSWILFDLFTNNENDACQLLHKINNFALSKGKTFIYILLQNNVPNLLLLKRAGSKYFTMPYLFLVKGSIIPREDEKIYIDIRDL